VGITKKLVLVTLSAVLLLLVVANTAAALRSLSLSETRIELLTRALTLEGGGLSVVCEVGITVTLNGNAILKRPRLVTARASVRVLGQEVRNERERCTTGRALVLLEHEPFNVNYSGFEGQLPSNITGIQLQLLAVTFQIERLGNTCLLQANILGTQRLTASGELEALMGEARERNFRLESVTVTRVEGLECPTAAEVRIRGELGPTRGVRVTLI